MSTSIPRSMPYDSSSPKLQTETDPSQWPIPEGAGGPSRYPGPWWTPKINYIYSSPEQLGNRKFLSCKARMNDMESSNANKYMQAYSPQPGELWIFDQVANKWQPPMTPNHSAIVQIPLHEIWLHGLRCFPNTWDFSTQNYYYVWIQNLHVENGKFISEGNTPPNDGNHLGIDQLVHYP